MLVSCDAGTPRQPAGPGQAPPLARLTLRAGEVAALALDDIDWRAREIIVHGKRAPQRAGPGSLTRPDTLRMMIMHNCYAPYVEGAVISVKSEPEVRRQLVHACRGLGAFGMGDLVGGGHISARLPGADACISHVFDRALTEITPDDVVKVSFDGTVSSPGRQASAGLSFHKSIYEHRPDVNAVVHAHAPWITAQSAFGRAPRMWNNHATLFAARDCAISPDGLLESIAPALRDKSTVIIPWHGAVTVGADIEIAAALHLLLEWVCRLDVMLSGTPASPMPDESVAEMRGLLDKVPLLEETWSLIERRGSQSLAVDKSAWMAGKAQL
jgi:L-fuculose-phosphate aldolase